MNFLHGTALLLSGTFLASLASANFDKPPKPGLNLSLAATSELLEQAGVRIFLMNNCEPGSELEGYNKELRYITLCKVKADPQVFLSASEKERFKQAAGDAFADLPNRIK